VAPSDTPTNSTKMTTLEACQTLFKGQSNVKIMANRLGVSLQEMQDLFGKYCDENKIDEDVWRGDIELGWPWV